MYSLREQIEEIDRELKMRREVYPRWVRSGKMRQSLADYHMDRLIAVRTTLAWLQLYETEIRGYMATRPSDAQNPSSTPP